jgi:hypothetical protein
MEAVAVSISPDVRLAAANGFMPALFVDAWAAIMNFDAIAQVVRKLKINSTEVIFFEQEANSVRSLRNKFQHFPGNLGNRANSKETRFPQYGAITWTYTPKPEPDNDVFVLLCNLCSLTELMEMRGVNPAGRNIRRPIGCMQLQAYGMIIEFERLREVLQHLVDFINTKMFRHITEQMQKYASDHGIEIARLAANNVGPLAFSVSGVLSDDGKQWTMRGADEQNQPHTGITSVPASD